MKHILVFLMCFGPLPLAAGLLSSDIVILGELHDNPHHHARQVELIGDVAPTAVVFEMLTPDEAERLNAVERSLTAMSKALEGVTWSNIADYADVLVASPVIVGAAVPSEDVRRAFSDGAKAVFGEDAARFGLADPVPDAQLQMRKELQFTAHCEAMPLDMMGGMVEAQRLRDAAFARSVTEAIARYGAPVVLITGNGHARTDWGVPANLAVYDDTLSVFSLGQVETDVRADAPFDTVEASPPAERDDPCEAFR